MGGHYGSVQVRTEDPDRVKAAAEIVARRKDIRCLVGPAINGWVAVYPENNGQDESVGREMAKLLRDDLLYLLVHDDDIFAYWFYREGREVDSYWSSPGYFGEENETREEAMTGNPEVFRPIVGDGVAKLTAVLARDAEYPFEYERLEKFAKVLKIANAVAAYEYIKEGDAPGLKRVREFEEVPADRIAQEAQGKRRERQRIKGERAQLKSQGLLLVHEEHKDQTIPYACAVGDGFLVAWPDHVHGTVRFEMHRPPWGKPRAIEVDVPAHVTAIASDASTKRVAMAAGNAVRVWDINGDAWTLVTGIPENDLAIGVALSPDGKNVAHVSRREIVVSEVASGRAVLNLPAKNDARALAFSADGRWIAAAGSTLGLIALDEEPHWREIFVGGKHEVSEAVANRLAARLVDLDPQNIEQKVRERTELMMSKLQERAASSNLPGLSREQLDTMRQQMEGQIKEAAKQLAALKAGEVRFPARPRETVFAVGFSRDGRWVWCGTSAGIRLFDWTAVSRAGASDWATPVHQFASQQSSNGPDYCYDIAEEVSGQAIAFCTLNGGVYRMDLASGQTHELARDPERMMAYSARLSLDGAALALCSNDAPDPTRIRRGTERRVFQVWAYDRLCGRE